MPASPGTDLQIVKWLVETLQQLELPADLLSRILGSARQALAGITLSSG